MKLQCALHIQAEPATVWAATLDLERWPEWSPTVDSLKLITQKPVGVGSVARLEQPGLPPAQWTVTEFTAGERFTWHTRVRGLHMTATHIIEPHLAEDATNATRSTLQLEITGFLACFLWPMIAKQARRSLEQENAGLKKWCEAVA